MEISYHLRKPNAERETPINAYIWNGSSRIFYPTGLKVLPKYWDTSRNLPETKGVSKTEKPNLEEIKLRLETLSREIRNQYQRYLNENNRPPSNEELKETLDKFLSIKPKITDKKEAKDLFSFIDRFLEESTFRVNDRTGKPLSKQTLQGFKKCKDYVHSFAKFKRCKYDFKDIDLDFYHDFSKYLTQHVGFAQNTVGKQIRILKIFLNAATERGTNTNFAFKSKRFKVVSEKVDSIYLSESELESLYSLNLSKDKRLDKVRDLFLVGCWTGLRFSDFTNIKLENIKGEYIEIETQKTAEKVTIPLHPTVKAIMSKYQGIYSNSLPPAISNVKMNLYLKELCQLVPALHETVSKSTTKQSLKVTVNTPKHELVTTHTARRSFATNLFLDGIPSEVIRAITGHRTEKSFNTYIKTSPREKADILLNHWKNK